MKQRDERRIQVERENGGTALLPIHEAARFQVYESNGIALAPGDMIRITQNGFTKDKRRLNNGDLKQVTGFTREGDIKLANGWVLPKNYGNLTHGYCVTSYGSQSKGVDCVFVAEGSESFRAADREQFYVSVSRFKERLTIYTDDKRALLEAASKTSQRPSATDLIAGGFRTMRPLRPTRFTPAQRRVQALEQVRQFSGEGARPEVLNQGAVMEPTIQPQRRSRGINP